MTEAFSDNPDQRYPFEEYVPDIRQDDAAVLTRMAGILEQEEELRVRPLLQLSLDLAATHPAKLAQLRQTPLPEQVDLAPSEVPSLPFDIAVEERDTVFRALVAEAKKHKLQQLEVRRQLLVTTCDTASAVRFSGITNRVTTGRGTASTGLVYPSNEVMEFLRNPTNGPYAAEFIRRQTSLQVNSHDTLVRQAANRALIVGIAYYATLATAVH